MAITVHEDFLPSDSWQKAALVFELGIPKFLHAHRNATWTILSRLEHLGQMGASSEPSMLLDDYSKVRPYMETSTRGVSMASSKKSFLQTQYKRYRMKIDWGSIDLPLGLSFEYYDLDSKVWIRNVAQEPVSLQHLCGLQVPKALLNAGVENPTKVSWTDGLTSRWMMILTELGASNLNFSDQETTQLLKQLAIQAAPTQETDDFLRDVHIFREDSFCYRLASQIERRLETIRANWREIHRMDLPITLALKLHALAAPAMRPRAYDLVQRAPKATTQWVSHHRNDYYHAEDADATMRVALYRFQASLLCRRPISVFADGEGRAMLADELRSFVEASIALQQSLAVDPAKLPSNLET
ncbi:hypothetical protein CDD83_8025 [Cordyceps sp. RAO-2017]|nr:hypothetical protein CDD83_8025 [Cordyceps sp. RAO-2017]